MILPFDDPDVMLAQGWLYDSPGTLCKPDPWCHYAVDYMKGIPGSRETFKVVAAAGGKAKYVPYVPQDKTGSESWGNYVDIQHSVDGVEYHTIYAHLDKSPLPSMQLVDVIAGQEIGDAGMTGKADGIIHLHFELKKAGERIDPYAIYKKVDSYPPHAICGRERTWITCPPVVLQPGPEIGKDIWTTSVYSYAEGGGGPGGGLDNYELVVGGWGDLYYSLLQFDLAAMPAQASAARLELFPLPQRGWATTEMFLDRINEAWDWKTKGTYPNDRTRLWWDDKPKDTVQWPGVLPACTVGQWYGLDITDLYNAWQDGTYQNFGVQLRPTPGGNNTWCEFYSSDYADRPSLRPRLVIEAADTPNPAGPGSTAIQETQKSIQEGQTLLERFWNKAIQSFKIVLGFGSEYKLTVYRPDGTKCGEQQSTVSLIEMQTGMG